MDLVWKVIPGCGLVIVGWLYYIGHGGLLSRLFLTSIIGLAEQPVLHLLQTARPKIAGLVLLATIILFQGMKQFTSKIERCRYLKWCNVLKVSIGHKTKADDMNVRGRYVKWNACESFFPLSRDEMIHRLSLMCLFVSLSVCVECLRMGSLTTVFIFSILWC